MSEFDVSSEEKPRHLWAILASAPMQDDDLAPLHLTISAVSFQLELSVPVEPVVMLQRPVNSLTSLNTLRNSRPTPRPSSQRIGKTLANLWKALIGNAARLNVSSSPPLLSVGMGAGLDSPHVAMSNLWRPKTPPLTVRQGWPQESEVAIEQHLLYKTDRGGPTRPTDRQIVETHKVYHRKEVQETVLLATGESLVSNGMVNQFHLLENIGNGAYGRVVRAMDEASHSFYACKIIDKPRLLRKFRFQHGGISAHMMRIKREVAVLKRLSDHPRVIRLCEVVDDEAHENLYLIFELCERGPLMTIQVGVVAQCFTEKEARKYFRDVFLGLEFLHRSGVIHLDIKPENIFLRADGTTQIGDFGLSIILADSKDDRIPIQSMTPLFTPPCALYEKNVLIHGKAADIWALGVTLYCFVHGHCPFEDVDNISLHQKILKDKPRYDLKLSRNLKHLLKQLLKKNVRNRITLDLVRTHPWLTDENKEPIMSMAENCPPEIPIAPVEIEGFFKKQVKTVLVTKTSQSIVGTSKSGLLEAISLSELEGFDAICINLPRRGDVVLECI